MHKVPSRIRGFFTVEALLATSVFALLATALVGAYLYGEGATAAAGERARATLLAEEGLEAVHNIRDSAFANLPPGTHGLAISANQWIFSGLSDSTGIFTRSIDISSIDANRDTVACTVSWQQDPSRTGSVTLTTRLTNWQATAVVASCYDYAIQQGYTGGSCVKSTTVCANNSGIYAPGGDQYCPSSNKVCCASGAPSSDTTPPAAVTDLAASNPTASSVSLSWTAPGDNGTVGTAASYSVRYATTPITTANWASATQALGAPAPLVAGSLQSMTVSGLAAATTYYFALTTTDAAGNVSGLSNVASATTITPITSCNGYALQQGYTSGSCVKNTTTCTSGGGTYAPGGDQYCSGSTKTCCAK
ncbi:MAG TPA: fibronectin type III domain-containing protein [Candidatus Paceibacterota bacterium]